MDRPRPRMLSPPRRLAGNPARNSTGFLDAGSSGYDAYYGYPRSSRESIPGPRGSAERVDEGRRRYVIPVRDAPPPRRMDDYDVPPRRAEPRAPPPKLVTPVQTSRPIARATGPISDYQARPRGDEGYYLTPGTSRGHHRASSTSGRTSDRSQYSRQPPPRERRERGYERGSRSYHNVPAIRQPRDQDDRDFGYEYTDFKEQARRDLLPAPRQRTRRESDVGPRERPASTMGIEEVKRSSRADGPPVTSRGFAKVPRNGEREYRGGSTRAPEPEYEPIPRRRSTRESDRGSISVHQDRDSPAEDVYRKQRRRRGEDDEKDKASRYDDRPPKAEERSKRHHERRASGDETRRHRHRHHRGDPRDYRDSGRDEPEREYVRRRSRGEDPERDRRNEPDEDREYRRRQKHAEPSEPERPKHHHFGSGAAALGAAATAAGFYAKQRHAHDSDAAAKRSTKEAGRPIEKSSQETMDLSDSDEDPEERRERRRRRRKERDERDEREPQERSRGVDEIGAESTRGNGVMVPQIRTEDDRELRGRRGSSESSDTNDSTEKRQVRLVSPEKEEARKPKGILKSPKVRFPEDPAPVREGVAPLKEAGKKGIPQNARWTKIDRRLVNPAALDVGNERYEERDDYVIVLRVLSKDEIKLYAAKTAELRDERRREDERRGQMLAIDNRAHQYEDEEEERPQLALDDHAYNEEVTIPSITATAPPTQAYAAAPPPAAAAPSQPLDPYATRPVAQANPEAPPPRPEAYSFQSYVRMPPQGASNSTASSIGSLAYPAPPPLQSSPQPSQPALGPPGAASYPPPPPPTVYPPPGSAAPPAPVYYPPPPGPSGGQQHFSPPQPGPSEPLRQQSVHGTDVSAAPPRASGETSPREGRSSQESDGPHRQV